MNDIADMLQITDYGRLLRATTEYCDRLLPSAEHDPVVPENVSPVLPALDGVRLVLWDIYGTLFATRSGDLEGSLTTPEAMLDSFELTAREFGWIEVFSSGGEAALWSRDLYLELIEQERELKKPRHSPYPEVRIDRIWGTILDRLRERGWQPESDGDDLLPWLNSLFYEVAFQQATVYTAVWPVLKAVADQGKLQGIVSNAQFYTPLLLHHFLHRQSAGMCGSPWEIFDPGLAVFSYIPELSKPDPNIFRPVIENAADRGIRPGEMLYVGNDRFNDVHGASRVGMKTVLFAADSGSLKMRKGVSEADNAQPDVVVTDIRQLPCILGTDAGSNEKTLKMGVWHYHLRPGGVTSVIRDTLHALALHGQCERYEINLFASLEESRSKPEWIDELNRLEGMTLRFVDLPELKYEDQKFDSYEQYARAADKLARRLLEMIDLSGCDTKNPYVLHLHNAELGKNPLAAGSIKSLAGIALKESLPLVILNQTHDFAEHHRPGRVRAWREATRIDDNGQRAQVQLPDMPNMIHLALTGYDRRKLISTGIESRSVFVLPNCVAERSSLTEANSGSIRDCLAGGRPYLLAAQKIMRRKNTLELLLATAAVRENGYDAGLVISLPAESESDREYERLVHSAAGLLGLPAVIGLQYTFGDNSPEFEQVLAGATAMVSASVMEGFGLGFLESWVIGRPVLGRWVDGTCDDFAESGIDLGHLYKAMLIDPDWLEGGIERLSEAYREYTDSLRSQLGFQPLDRKTFDKEFERYKIHSGPDGKSYLDFGDLSAEMQYEVIERIAGESDGETLKAILDINKSLSLWTNTVTDMHELVEQNRESVLRLYGQSMMASRIENAIAAARARLRDIRSQESPADNARTLDPLLEETVSLQDTRLLYS